MWHRTLTMMAQLAPEGEARRPDQPTDRRDHPGAHVTDERTDKPRAATLRPIVPSRLYHPVKCEVDPATGDDLLNWTRWAHDCDDDSCIREPGASTSSTCHPRHEAVTPVVAGASSTGGSTDGGWYPEKKSNYQNQLPLCATRKLRLSFPGLRLPGLDAGAGGRKRR